MGITFVLASAAFGQVRRLVTYGGVFQRISVVTGLSFETSLGGNTSNNNATACARESVAVSLTVGDEARLRPRLGADGFYGRERVACAHAEIYVGEWWPLVALILMNHQAHLADCLPRSVERHHGAAR